MDMSKKTVTLKGSLHSLIKYGGANMKITLTNCLAQIHIKAHSDK